MASGVERSPRERATLIFKTPEEAEAFREGARERMLTKEAPGIRRDREAVGELVARELERQGEVAQGYNTPWEHSEEEHQETQKLVDMAFKEDLMTAVKQAQNSAFYPRILDLLHDVLTGQLYEMILEKEINRVKINKILIAGLAGVVMLAIGAVLFLFI